MKILAGIVLYNPDPERLTENISAIKGQVDCVAVFDNGAGEMALADNSGTIIVLSQNGENVGIATAQNRIFEYALNNGYDWVLTLDQDSCCPENIISEYSKYVNENDVAILCPFVTDRNMQTKVDDSMPKTESVDMCIASGNLVRVSAWQEVGGFWDDLFIDLVDFDFCWSLVEKGYRILRVNSVVLYHELGHSKSVKIFGRGEAVFNHAPVRSYYMTRNTILVGRRHHKQRLCWKWQGKRIFLINLFEKERLKKDKMIIRGLFDGWFKYKVRKNDT